MKISENVKVRQVAGENVVIMPGEKGTDMTNVVALNESAMFLYEALKGSVFEINDVVRMLMDEYDVDFAMAQDDAREWIAQMQKNCLLEL